MTPARAVLFDLDGTLHDRNATARGWLNGHRQRFGLPAAYAGRWLALDDFGYRPKREVFPLLKEELGLSCEAEALLEDFSAFFLARPVLMPWAVEVLERLRAGSVRLGIVTNGLTGWRGAQRRCMEGLGLLPLVDDVLDSVDVGYAKPDPRIYLLALERLGVRAEHTWFVSDSPRNDVWGSQQVGMRAAFLHTGHALKDERPDAVLRDLRDVVELP